MTDHEHEKERADFARHLVSSGRDAAEATEVADLLNLDNFTREDGTFDRPKLHAFADKFRITAGPVRSPDFGAGRRGPSPHQHRLTGGQAEAQRRFTTESTEDDEASGPTFRSAEAERRYGGGQR